MRPCRQGVAWDKKRHLHGLCNQQLHDLQQVLPQSLQRLVKCASGAGIQLDTLHTHNLLSLWPCNSSPTAMRAALPGLLGMMLG